MSTDRPQMLTDEPQMLTDKPQMLTDKPQILTGKPKKQKLSLVVLALCWKTKEDKHHENITESATWPGSLGALSLQQQSLPMGTGTDATEIT